MQLWCQRKVAESDLSFCLCVFRHHGSLSTCSRLSLPPVTSPPSLPPSTLFFRLCLRPATFLPPAYGHRPRLLLRHGGRERADEAQRHGHQAPGQPDPERSGALAGDRQQDVFRIQRLARAGRHQRVLLQAGEEAPAAGQGVGHRAAAAQRQGQGEM